MVCPKCHSTIPGDSAFCPFCGQKHENIQKNCEYLKKDETRNSVNPVKPEKVDKASKKKTCFCKYCGGELEKGSTICKQCGKKVGMEIGILSAKKFMVPLLVIVLGFLCVFGIVQTVRYHNVSTELVETKKEIAKHSYDAEKYDNVSVARDIKEKAKFMDRFIVFVYEDDSDYYHKYGCKNHTGESFFAYNTNTAISMHYSPCPDCCY